LGWRGSFIKKSQTFIKRNWKVYSLIVNK